MWHGCICYVTHMYGCRIIGYFWCHVKVIGVRAFQTYTARFRSRHVAWVHKLCHTYVWVLCHTYVWVSGQGLFLGSQVKWQGHWCRCISNIRQGRRCMCISNMAKKKRNSRTPETLTCSFKGSCPLTCYCKGLRVWG